MATIEVLRDFQHSDRTDEIIKLSNGLLVAEYEITPEAVVRGGYTVVPWLQALVDDIEIAIPQVTSFGTYPGHHPTPERAVDIFVPKVRDGLGKQVAEFILRNWNYYGMRYLIWWQSINYNDGRGWILMEDRGDDTQNHRDHLHGATNTSGIARPKSLQSGGFLMALDDKEQETVYHGVKFLGEFVNNDLKPAIKAGGHGDYGLGLKRLSILLQRVGEDEPDVVDSSQ